MPEICIEEGRSTDAASKVTSRRTHPLRNVSISDLWDELTEEEREVAMRKTVERVDIHSKTEGTCSLRILSKSLSRKWKLSSIWERGSDSN
jgi:hypothetical protein